ncbi:L-threonylcarbamoyladenylate synthase [Methylomagnum ishizawai]|uniref:Threonylcarbamoyl-AMP synthase n=1 Tax=Methylomagnum ishizawai TaxID=1760988 RepID=A0A1Y6CZX7_9GAMM|nr:Sua5/YciO/YrdC/YwlC family protein [Methylomagnum ishizawai]SMF94133.1 L-threonylcarbamoyladenylate synthase [Methylomagnum ishizawai]
MISPFQARFAARHLRRGGLIAYPTEGVYGLGCAPLDRAAVQRLLGLKGRSAAKGFILIAAGFAQVEPFLDIPNPQVHDRLLAAWPGPVTFVVPAAAWVPDWLRGASSNLAVRVTAHPGAAALCRTFGGPLVSTSANKSGHPPARGPLAIRKHFPAADALLVPGRLGGASGPTPIYEAVSGKRLR